MARTDRMIKAPPQTVFGVLADPRGYAYWVIGSHEIRDADPGWPQVGTKIHHTVALGPLRLKDHTVVEEVQPARFLKLQAKTRPLGKARVALDLQPMDGGTRVTMVEDPADRLTALVFMPLTHLLMRKRNVRSLERLAELAEGRRALPGEDPGTVDESGDVQNPAARDRRKVPPAATARACGLGAAAGLAGALAMSASTNAEMRLRGRGPSHAPAEAVAGLLGVSSRGRRRRQLLGLGGHLATAVSFGVVRGLLDRMGLGSRAAGAALFAGAMIPETVVVPALGAADAPWRWSPTDTAVSLVHHAVFAAATTAAYERLAGRG